MTVVYPPPPKKKKKKINKYCMLKNDTDNGRTYNGLNWAYQIKSMLDRIGLSNVWVHQFEITIPYNLIKQRISDMCKQSWYSSINNSNRLEMYSRFKHEFNMENYLDFIKEKNIDLHLHDLDCPHTIWP